MALKKLAKDGVIAKDFSVLCHVVAREDGREVSLIENVHRVATDAMDEVDAYAALVDEAPRQMTSPAALASRGVTSTNASRWLDYHPRSRPPGNAEMSVLKPRGRSAWSTIMRSSKQSFVASGGR